MSSDGCSLSLPFVESPLYWSEAECVLLYLSDPAACRRVCENSPTDRYSTDGLQRRDLIEVRMPHTVPVLSEALKQPELASTLLSDYAVEAPDNVRALRELLTSLSEECGRGFFLHSGPGCGKSHLLTVLGLLARDPGWCCEVLQQAGRTIETQLGTWAGRLQLSSRQPLLVVAVSLEAHRGSDEELEEIVWRELEPLSAVGACSPDEGLARPERSCVDDNESPGFEGVQGDACRRAARASRAERLRALVQTARSEGFRGVLILLDELSQFLASRCSRGFANDVSWLQFLGQQSSYCPLWLVGAMQRELETIARIDGPMLRKLRDRYTWDLVLSSEQMRPVVSKTVVTKRNPELFEQTMQALWVQSGSGVRWSPDELAEIYPLDPLTFHCLVSASARFFSGSRSILHFTAASSRSGMESPAAELVEPGELFDYFWPAVLEYPELSPVRDAFDYYRREIERIVPGEGELALRVIRCLAALALAGLRPPLRDVAAALTRGAEEHPAWLERVRSVLEQLHTRGGYIQLARAASPEGDLYWFDPVFDVTRLLRDRVGARMETLTDGDERIALSAALACQDADLPLSFGESNFRVEVEWLHSTRKVSAALCDLRSWTREEALADLQWLADERQPEVARLLIGELHEPQAQADSFLQVLREFGSERWALGLVGWAPRPLTHPEQQLLREFTACRLLLQDPSFRMNAPGRKLLDRLQTESARLLPAVQDVIRSAYSSGQLLWRDGVIECGELSGASVGEMAARFARTALPALFPCYPEVAPSRSPRGAPALLLRELILPGRAEITSPAAGFVRDVAHRLGIAVVRGEQYHLCDPPSELLSAALRAVPEHEETTWEGWFGRLEKSPFGLPRELSELLASALVRRGHLELTDSFGMTAALHSEQQLPLSASTRALRRSDTLSAGQWDRLEQIASSLDCPLERRSPDALEELWSRIRELRRSSQTETLRERLEQLAQQIGGGSWEGPLQALEDWDSLMEAVQDDASPITGLGRLLDTLPRDLEASLQLAYSSWRAVHCFVHDSGPRLVRAVERLGAVSLPAGSPLEERVSRFLQAASGGERVVSKGQEAAAYAESLLLRYSERYLQWHLEVFGEARFAPFQQLLLSREWQAAALLERLPLGLDAQLPELERNIRELLSLQCSSAGLAAGLLRSPVCTRCKLPIDSPAPLPAVSQFQQKLHELLLRSCGELRREERYSLLKKHLDHDLKGSPAEPGFSQLLSLLSEGSSLDASSAVAAVLNEDVAREIARALTRRVSTVRCVADLEKRLAGKEMTRYAAVRSMLQWLDPDSSLSADDMVRFER